MVDHGALVKNEIAVDVFQHDVCKFWIWVIVIETMLVDQSRHGGEGTHNNNETQLFRNTAPIELSGGADGMAVLG